MHRLAPIALTALLLSGCGTTSVGLKYAISQPVAKVSTTAAPLVLGTFADQRGEPPTWLGAIRGGFGNPLKNLESDRPVSEVVKTAFADGLRARGVALEASGRQNQLVGTVKKLDCSQYVRREAYAEIELTVLDANGQRRFSRVYKANNLDGSVMSLNAGVFASVDDLRVVLEKTLREVVDQALDDSALRAALQL
jgi:uncharacterized lipoprotein YajG